MAQITVTISTTQEVNKVVDLNTDTPIQVMLNIVRDDNISPSDGHIWKMRKSSRVLNQFETLYNNRVQDGDTVELKEY